MVRDFLGTVRIFVSVLKWHGHLGRDFSRAGSPCHQLTQNFLQAHFLVSKRRFFHVGALPFAAS